VNLARTPKRKFRKKKNGDTTAGPEDETGTEGGDTSAGGESSPEKKPAP
jgi:hypothetical protein